MYDTACLRLADNGYHQYEISNFAKEGKACRHNLSYWERKNYLGFGTGAASLLCEQRYTNTDSLALYIDTMAELEEKKEVISKALAAVRAEQHTLSVPEQMEEMFFLGLRKNMIFMHRCLKKIRNSVCWCVKTAEFFLQSGAGKSATL